MNYNDIVADILRLTRRPDKVLDIGREVNAAALAFASDYDYPRSYQEANVVITTDLTQAVAIPANLPRLRKIAYIKRGGSRNYLKKIERVEMFSAVPCDYRDKYYIVGDAINISMVVKAATLDIGFYQFHPYLTSAAPDSWLLEGGWHFVRARALGRIYNDIGDTTEARNCESLANRDYMIYRNSAVASGE